MFSSVIISTSSEIKSNVTPMSVVTSESFMKRKRFDIVYSEYAKV
jgi:hypothetical protein